MANQKKYHEDEVTCPYYTGETATEIKCEGIVGDSSVSVFKTKKEKEDHKYDFCNGCYRNCPINIELELKYSQVI